MGNSLALCNDDRCVQIAVLALGCADDRDDLVHQAVERFVFGQAIDVGGGLEPLVEIPIVP